MYDFAHFRERLPAPVPKFLDLLVELYMKRPVPVESTSALIDIHEGDKVGEAALKDLIRAAMALNLNVQAHKA